MIPIHNAPDPEPCEHCPEAWVACEGCPMLPHNPDCGRRDPHEPGRECARD